MADLGTETGNATLSMGGKIMEAMMRLFELVFKGTGSAIGKGVDIHQKNKALEFEKEKVGRTWEKEDAYNQVNGGIGEINLDVLKKSGVPLTAIGMDVSEEQMRAFGNYCRREGMVYSVIKEDNPNVDGTYHYTIMMKKDDLETAKAISERMNRDRVVNEADRKIDELKAKGENMTEQDKVDVDYLQKQKEDVQKEATAEMNDKAADNIIENSVTGEDKEVMDIHTALNRYTGHAIDKDRLTVIADANDPDKYILCHGQKDEFNGKEYTKTEYEVFRNGESVLKTHDGRFEGRPDTYWDDTKESIMKAGEFSGTFLKFDTVEHYKEWADRTKEENQAELANMKKEENLDYDAVIQDLESQLDRNGAMLKDGNVMDKETGEPLIVKADMPREKQLIMAESLVIGSQIVNYQEMKELATDRAVAEVNLMSVPEGSEEHGKAKEEFERVDTRFQEVKTEEQKLLSERQKINASQNELEVRGIPTLELLEENKKKVAEKEKNAPVLSSDEKADDRRSDKINELEEKQENMEEYKKDLQKKREELTEQNEQSNGAKANENLGKDAKPKKSDHDDR